MKKNAPLMLGLLSLGMVSGAATAVVTTNAFAAEDTTTVSAEVDTQNSRVLTEEQQAMKTLHEAAEKALEAGDYATWSSTMTQINEARYQNVKEAITQDNFTILQQIQTAREAKDFETVRTLSQQIGAPLMGMGGMHGGPRGEANGSQHMPMRGMMRGR